MRRSEAWLLIASLLVALGLYLQVQPGDKIEREREFSVPLQVVGLEPKFAAREVPSSVLLLATGTEEELRVFDTRQVEASVSMTRAVPGEGEYAVRLNVPTRANVRVTARDPVIRITVEERTVKRIDVELEPVGSLSPLYSYGGASFQPMQVTVSGPASMMEQVAHVRAILNLEDAQPKGAYALNLEALDTSRRPVAGVSIEPKQVTVSPVIFTAPTSRNLFVQLRTKGQLAFGYEVKSYTITPNMALASGEPDLMARQSGVLTESIDITELKADKSFDVKLVSPEGVSLSPERVRVTLIIGRASGS